MNGVTRLASLASLRRPCQEARYYALRPALGDTLTESASLQGSYEGSEVVRFVFMMEERWSGLTVRTE